MIRIVYPTRSLFDRQNPLIYVHSSQSDIRKTFAKYVAIRPPQPQQSKLS